MKKIIAIFVVAVIGCIMGYIYYNEQITTAYYRVSIYPPTSYDSNSSLKIQFTAYRLCRAAKEFFENVIN